MRRQPPVMVAAAAAAAAAAVVVVAVVVVVVVVVEVVVVVVVVSLVAAAALTRSLLQPLGSGRLLLVQAVAPAVLTSLSSHPPRSCRSVTTPQKARTCFSWSRT